ncbi:MAG: DUF4912 domain-containing protein [Clostridia bacterium]|nr:DUF4912 domain-containing protein [Clostridia bacterium]
MIWFILALALILILILLFYYELQKKLQKQQIKIDLPPNPLPPPLDWETAAELEPELPSSYQQNYLELLVQGPTCLYAYWETDPFVQAPVLRLFRLEDQKFWQKEANWQQIDLFWPDLEPNQSYQLELGYLNSNGEFNRFLVSRAVRTPPNTTSLLEDAQWPIIPELCPQYSWPSNPGSSERPPQ